ncbi:hypothetical protein JXA85_06490 [Candidatus Woesearchaeota archaeon]|nr:hypothetical protein [Candidatus Woesearchaeota archaeon]
MEDYLLENEHIMKESSVGKTKVVLTNLRIIKFWKHATETDFEDMHYRFIETIKHCQKLSWVIVFFAIIFLVGGFAPLFFLDNLMISGFCWIIGILLLIQAYLFERSYIEVRTANSSMTIHNDPEIPKLLRKYQEKYLRQN